MRKISQTTLERINAIYETQNYWESLFHKNEEKTRILELLGQSTEIAAIPLLVPLLFERDSNYKNAASRAIESLLRNCQLTDYVWLEENTRYLSPHIPKTKLELWYKLDLAYSKKAMKERILINFCSFHPNGHIREEAVKKLSKIKDGSELPFLLVRLNDWVAPVREQAQMAIKERLIPEYASVFIENIPLVIRLHSCRRVNHHNLVESVFSLLKRNECFQAVWNGLESKNSFAKQLCYRLALDLGNSIGPAILDKALKELEPIIRLMAARVICSNTLFSGYIARLIEDRYAPIRRLALTTLSERNPFEAISELKNALLDPHISVREVARSYLGSQTDIDFTNYYLDYIWGEESKSLSTALIALGEVRSPDVAEVLADYANTNDGLKVKRAAIKGLSYLDTNQFLELYYTALQSENSGISYEGYCGLRKRAHLVESNRLLELLHKTQYLHVLKNTVLLFSSLNKWEQLRCLLLAFQTIKEDNIHLEIKGQLKKWINSYNRRVQSRPITIKVELLHELLKEMEHDLGEKVVRELKFLIQ